MRVGASHKNPTRRWRYKNKTIVLFFMDSSMTVEFTAAKNGGELPLSPVSLWFLMALILVLDKKL